MPPIAKSAVIAALAVVALLACCCLWFAQIALADDAPASAQQVDFYRVPLMCPAARGLGCGSRAKPILLELEKAQGVAEAWLDHSGETLAVVWASDSSASQRAAILANISKEHSVRLQELSADTRESSLTSFRARKGWYRGADVDRLSEVEAGVIADRFISRTIQKAPGAKDKMEALRPTLTDTIRQQIVGEMPAAEERRSELMATVRSSLSESEMGAFASAVDLGYRPVGDEK